MLIMYFGPEKYLIKRWTNTQRSFMIFGGVLHHLFALGTSRSNHPTRLTIAYRKASRPVVIRTI